jgi:hypothetical protein
MQNFKFSIEFEVNAKNYQVSQEVLERCLGRLEFEGVTISEIKIKPCDGQRLISKKELK